MNAPSWPVLQIRDVYPGSRIRLFSIPDPGSELSPSRIPDPGSSKNLSILTPKKPKKWFLSSKKYDPGCSSRIPDADFLPIPDPGSRGQKAPDPGSATLIRTRTPGSISEDRFPTEQNEKPSYSGVPSFCTYLFGKKKNYLENSLYPYLLYFFLNPPPPPPQGGQGWNWCWLELMKV